MTEMESIDWWLALWQAMSSMNRQVHSTTGKSPYKVVFKQLMPNCPRISPAMRPTADVVDNAESQEDLDPSIDPQLQVTSNIPEDTEHQPALQSQAIQRLKKRSFHIFSEWSALWKRDITQSIM